MSTAPPVSQYTTPVTAEFDFRVAHLLYITSFEVRNVYNYNSMFPEAILN